MRHFGSTILILLAPSVSAIAQDTAVFPAWLRGVPAVAAVDSNEVMMPVEIEFTARQLGAGRDGVRLVVPGRTWPSGAVGVKLDSLRLRLAEEREYRVLSFDALETAPARVTSFGKRVESEYFVLFTDADGGEAFSVRCVAPAETRQHIAVVRRADGAGAIEVEFGIGDDSGAVTDLIVEIERAASAWAAIEAAGLVQGERDLATASHADAVACLESTTRSNDGGQLLRALRVPVRARPLDAFRGDGKPSVWVGDAGEGFATAVLINASPDARVVGFALLDVAANLGAGAVVSDLATGESLGVCRDGALVPLPPNSTRRLRLAPLGEAPLPATEVDFIRATSPQEVATTASIAAHSPELAAEFDATMRGGDITLVHLPGGGSLDPLPPAIARHVLPFIVPHRAVSRSVAPRGAEDRFTKLASNLEWTLAFSSQQVDSRDWLVCLEAGFLATPLQPRIVDGMPAARGFAVHLSPGALIVTSGLSPDERGRMREALLDPKPRLEAMRQLVAAQQAVRLDREPVGLFAGLAHLSRFRSEDFVPGDPIVVARWATVLPPTASRRLRTLAVPNHLGVPGSGRLTEDVIVSNTSISFAIDVPHPFVEPLNLVVRRVDSGAPFDITYEGRPLRRVARNERDAQAWAEELYQLRASDVGGQRRVLLTLESHGEVAEIARVGFYVAGAGNGRALGDLEPTAAEPNDAGPTFGARADGTAIGFAGRVHPNAFEMAGGSRLEFKVPDGRAPSSLVAEAIAAPDEPAGGGAVLVIRVDGVEKARLDLQGQDPKPRTVRVALDRNQRIEFECFSRAEGVGQVFVLDPRLR
jgi:hypothetical protein